MTCAECNGRGWVKDGTSHGGLCMACASPEVLKAVNAVKRAPARTPSKQDADHKKPRKALAKAAKTRTLTSEHAQVALAASDRTPPVSWLQCLTEGCSTQRYRRGYCKRCYSRISKAKARARKKAAQPVSAEPGMR